MAQPVLFKDRSITSLSGSSQAAIGLNGQRQFLQIQNTGNASVAVNNSGPATGGTGPGRVGNAASIGGTGRITLGRGHSVTFDRAVPER